MYVWLKTLFGLWSAWLIFSVLSLFLGFFWGTITYVRDIINSTVIGFPSNIADAMDMTYSWFTSIWNWIGLILFGAVLLFLYINSARREPYEIYT